VTRWRCTGTDWGGAGIAKGVRVDVRIPLQDSRVIVNEPIAVVIDRITGLGRAREDRVVTVIAVVIRCRQRISVGAAGGEVVTVAVKAVVRGAVAVIVQAVTVLCVAREVVAPGSWVIITVVIGARRGAVSAARCHAILIEIKPVIDRAIAVLIHTVAGFGNARIDPRCRVIAVGVEGAVGPTISTTVRYGSAVGITVFIGVRAEIGRSGRPGIRIAIAVVVYVVAELSGATIDQRVTVITIISPNDSWAAGHLEVTIIVLIKALICQTTAVVVQTITDLQRTGINRRIGVITIPIAGSEAIPIVVRTITAGTTCEELNDQG